MKNEIELIPTYWASVSGGKDSLYMLKLILQHPERYPLDGVIHFELEIDYPFIRNVIDYMESECKKHGVKFVRIKPTKTWEEHYNSERELGRQFAVLAANPKYNADYMENIIKNKWLYKLNEEESKLIE